MTDTLLQPSESDPWESDAPTEDAMSGEAALLGAQATTLVQGEMLVETVEATRDPEREGLVVLHGRLLKPSETVFPRWLREFGGRGYTPLLRPDAQAGGVQLRIARGIATRKPSRLSTHLILFILTVISTLWVGMLYGGENVQVNSFWDLLRPSNLLQGWPFAVTLLSILAAHEFGHYFAARYHGVAVTLPYFIPMPLGFGTMGAFIQMREPVRDRRQLFDIGVAGPLAGLVLAVPLLFLGLRTSETGVPVPGLSGWVEGNSLLYLAAKYQVFGRLLPDAATGLDVFMNQVTFAAWIGLLVTAINLLPLGQLDGGHTVFAMFGEKARLVNQVTLGIMVLLGIAGLNGVQRFAPVLESVGYAGWLFWVFLILFLVGPYHPPALDDVTRLNNGRRLVGFLVILIFLLTFVPVPQRAF